MNKKAVASRAIIIFWVFLLVISLTTGILFALPFEGSRQNSIESDTEGINQGTLLRNILRTHINGTDMNMAEFMISYSYGEVEFNTLDIKHLFLEIQILDPQGNVLLTMEGTQKKYTKKIESEQVIPNYVGESPPYYIIKMQQTKET